MKKNFFISTACLSLILGFTALPLNIAQAQELGTMYYYPLTNADYYENINAWRVFMEYDQRREPCQNYVAPPVGYVMKGCSLYRADRYVTTETMQETKTVATERTEPSASYYTVYFDFDKSNIRANERANIAEIAKELQAFNLEEVTVSGHTDRSGQASYNQSLSVRRAHTVANELNAYGIRASVISEYAYGESDPVEMLGDGAKSQANRRVIINYKR